jgi:hypothetical protein
MKEMIHLLIPRRLRILGFRRISSPVLAIILLLLIVLILITIFPQQIERSEHEESHHKIHKKSHLIDNRFDNNYNNDGNQVIKPNIDSNSNNLPVFRDGIIGNIYIDLHSFRFIY